MLDLLCNDLHGVQIFRILPGDHPPRVDISGYLSSYYRHPAGPSGGPGGGTGVVYPQIFSTDVDDSSAKHVSS
jgi:hypothetical protein